MLDPVFLSSDQYGLISKRILHGQIPHISSEYVVVMLTELSKAGAIILFAAFLLVRYWNVLFVPLPHFILTHTHNWHSIMLMT